MRYRFEFLDDILYVRNVENDVVVGMVRPSLRPNPHNPHLPILAGCLVFNLDGETLAYLPVKEGQDPFKVAQIIVAADEKAGVYPSFQYIKKRPDPDRVEFQLGELLADAAAAMAGAVIEHLNGGLSAETKGKFGNLIAQLHAIWYASRFGSFNAERKAHEAYFANRPPSYPRLNFAQAAEQFGMEELHYRFPDAPEAALQEILSWVLEQLKRTLDRLMPLETVERTLKGRI